jgi:phosphoribosylformimino-5-aminoimidazole carboxamide ribotide isomerase
MIILPAIDLKGGHCVRLCQGRADQATVYGDDPVAMARHWLDLGARHLHVVDLDGAFAGKPAHTAVIARIVAATGIPVEVGGGLRTDEDVAEILGAGVAQAIIGTRALADPVALGRMVARWGDHIAVGIDARDGFVQVKGWVETTRTRAVDLARQVETLGVGTIIYTDTATDGMLAGPNADAMDQMCRAVRCRVVASGGISTAEHIRQLVRLGHANLHGVIVGKALYEGRTTLPELLAAAG